MPNTVPEGYLWVVAAAIVNAEGEVLLAQRPLHKHQGGLWEFPGGKVELGESALQALGRELEEELGIVPEKARPLMQLAWSYPGQDVWLDVWLVNCFKGIPYGREGQPIRWCAIEELDERSFPAANMPVLKALRLPSLLMITAPDGRFPVHRPHALLVLRRSGLTVAEYCLWVEQIMQVWPKNQLLLHDHWEIVEALGVAGVHCSSLMWKTCEQRLPLPANFLIGGSAHTVEDIEAMNRLEMDYATVSPVCPTASHPGATVLGWDGFACISRMARLPVYALGGMQSADLEVAWQRGAQGIAAIRAFQEHAENQLRPV